MAGSLRNLGLLVGASGVVLLGCGCGSAAPGGSSATATPGATAPPGAVTAEQTGKLALEADPDGQLAYTTKRATATAGRVTISMRNMSGVMHNLAIQSGTSGPVLAHTEFQTDGTASFSVELKPGTYTFFCQAPGHRAAGMFGTLTVAK